MYSQNDEERYILRAVGGITGRFLDIGAYNPTQFSNTRALYERGWSGVMVEPSPEPFMALLKEYANEKRIKLVHAAVGDGSMVRFHASADAVSTSDQRVYDTWKNATTYAGTFYVPTITVESLLLQFGRDFEFVNFDAEGVSVELFRQFLTSGARPKCICVEHDGHVDDCRKWATMCGYSELAMNGENLVFGR